MKRRVIIKKAIAVAVTMSLMTCLVPNGSITVNAASKKSMLSKTKISVNVGKKKTVKLKKAKYKVVWKIISGKKNISIKKKGKYKQKIQIKGKKIGKAKIKAVYGKKKYILKVTVKGNNKENISKNVETPKNIETTSKTTVQTTVEPTKAPKAATTVAPTKAPTVAPTKAPTVAPTAAPTQSPVISDTTEIVSNLESTYATNDPQWLLNASDDDIVTVVYTCTDPSHGNWGILGWGASVDNVWQSGDNYSAASNATDKVTKTYTVKELKATMNIKSTSKVTYLCLSAWNGGKIVSLTLSKVGGETPQPTVTPTVAPTATPTVAPTVAPTAAPTTEPSGDSKVTGSVKLTSNWGSGGIAEITLTNNTGVSYTDGWTVEFTLDREITSMWSGTCESLGNNRYRVSNPGWDGNWANGKTITLNCGVGGGSNVPAITDIVIK